MDVINDTSLHDCGCAGNQKIFTPADTLENALKNSAAYISNTTRTIDSGKEINQFTLTLSMSVSQFIQYLSSGRGWMLTVLNICTNLPRKLNLDLASCHCALC